MTNRLLTLALAAALQTLYTPQLFAQARAALVKNVDEPGRSPYQAVQMTFNNCGVYGFAYFPAVPAGKRLVVTFVSGQFQLTTTSKVYVRLLSAPSLTTSCAVITASRSPFFRFRPKQPDRELFVSDTILHRRRHRADSLHSVASGSRSRKGRRLFDSGISHR